MEGRGAASGVAFAAVHLYAVEGAREAARTARRERRTMMVGGGGGGFEEEERKTRRRLFVASSLGKWEEVSEVGAGVTDQRHDEEGEG